jgi:alcohol dehydrogenase class IV
MFPIPHGVACARLLATVADVNLRALRTRAPESPAIARYDEVARIITGNRDARAEDGVAWLHALAEDLGVPTYSTYGIREADIPRIVAEAKRASSMQGNPIVLSDVELTEILRSAI